MVSNLTKSGMSEWLNTSHRNEVGTHQVLEKGAWPSVNRPVDQQIKFTFLWLGAEDMILCIRLTCRFVYFILHDRLSENFTWDFSGTYPPAQNQYMQEKIPGAFIFARIHVGPVFALRPIQENIFEELFLKYVFAPSQICICTFAPSLHMDTVAVSTHPWCQYIKIPLGN